MNILEVIPSLRSGGAENFVVTLSNELAKNRCCKVTILTLYPPKENEFLKNKIGENVILINLTKKKGVDFSLLFKILRVIVAGKYDICHFHIQAIIYCLVASLFYRKCKYYATIHSDAYKEAIGIHRYVRKFLFFFKFVTPITISPLSQQSFYNLYKVKSVLIYNGVPNYMPLRKINLNKYRRTNQTKILLNVASIIPLKNQILFAKITNRLFLEGYDIVSLVLGKTSNINYYNSLKKLESDCFHIIGEVNNPVDYDFQSDFFVLVSEYEGLPISLLEALSVNCVPIVTPVGGIPNIIKDGYNGFVAEDIQEENIYEAIKRAIITTDSQINEMKKHISKDFHLYSIERCAALHFKLFSLE